MAILYRPLADFEERVAEIAGTFVAAPRHLGMFTKAADRVDRAAVRTFQQRYRDDLRDFDPSYLFKYADFPYWIGHKTRLAAGLNLDVATNLNVLDIGVGAGHFPAVCQALGHSAIGIDLDHPVYNDMCRVLSVRKKTHRLLPGHALPEFDNRFDMVTAFAIVFDVIDQDKNRYWSTEDWGFFFQDLFDNHLKFPAVIHLELNQRMGGRFNLDFLQWIERKRATVDFERGVAELRAEDHRTDFLPQRIFYPVNRTPRPAPQLELLVLDSPRAPLSRFRVPSASAEFSRQFPVRSEAIKIRGTFPIPGRRSSSTAPEVRFAAEELIFPGPGEYYFFCDIGAFKILVLGHSEPILRAAEVAAFVSKNVIHSQGDSWLQAREGQGASFYWNRLAEKFFFSDQPLQLHCGSVSSFLGVLLHHQGFECRLAQLAGRDDGHIVLEVWHPDHRRWAMFDPDFGVVVKNRLGEIVSAQEFADFVATTSGDRLDDSAAMLRIVDIAGKRWTKDAFSVPGGFSGQMTWTPASDTGSDAGDSSGYISAWRRCLGVLRYVSMNFDEAQRAVRFKHLD